MSAHFQIDQFIEKSPKWQEEMKVLRAILFESELTEQFKWKTPCYTYMGKNIVIMQAFKSYFAIGFIKGVLLKDKFKVLEKSGENTIQIRQIRFENVQDIMEKKAILKSYILESIEIEKLGLKFTTNENKKLNFPLELIQKFKENAAFKKGFESLTPGCQRAYNLYFSGAKQSETKKSRIEKYAERIIQGKRLNECVCGHSKRMPYCDGSHKLIVNC